MKDTVLGCYQSMVADGDLDHDPAQVALAQQFDRFLLELTNMRLASKGSTLGWLFARRQKERPVKGLYIWGDVGRGKTMLMDLFYELAPIKRKHRAHFHEFMADIHERVHAHRQALKAGTVKGDDPIPPVATDLAARARLICFDEFSVTDITDAMILGRLFAELFNRGVSLVATSNVMPDLLYKDGLNRGHFLPFIALLKEHVDVVRLDARTDFRLEKIAGSPVFLTPLGLETTQALDQIWETLTGHRDGFSEVLEVKGRVIPVPVMRNGIARFSFADLCEAPLGAADYLKIAHRFHTVLLDNIPVLSKQKRNEAKRFINLIDAFYDNSVKLIASAAAEPVALYDAESGTEAFEFQRTASRLIEMQSETYLALPHRGARPGD